jgi:hypothetical protein
MAPRDRSTPEPTNPNPPPPAPQKQGRNTQSHKPTHPLMPRTCPRQLAYLSTLLARQPQSQTDPTATSCARSTAPARNDVRNRACAGHRHAHPPDEGRRAISRTPLRLKLGRVPGTLQGSSRPFRVGPKPSEGLPAAFRSKPFPMLRQEWTADTESDGGTRVRTSRIRHRDGGRWWPAHWQWSQSLVGCSTYSALSRSGLASGPGGSSLA